MKLSVVATPIGNLEDITLRALRTLKEADIVAAEDTRVTGKLLAHFDIHTRVVSFHANSGEKGIEKIIAFLEEGKHVALVSDAGTPGVSDPGALLVARARERCGEELSVETVPGPSALAAALAVAGLRAATFLFWGFLPLKKGRQTCIQEMATMKSESVAYESTHRIEKFLEQFAAVAPERRMGLYRELTKLYEEHILGTATEVLETLRAYPEKKKGEFVIVVEEK